MKGPEAFRTISEAADELGVPQHVLRFWETKFSFIRPMKRAGGRRFYRPQDLAVLKGVRALLHDEGYTIKGVQRLHKEQGIKRLLQGPQAAAPEPDIESDGDGAAADHSPALVFPFAAQEISAVDRARLHHVLDDLQAAKARLNRLIREP